ncbi:hypothetical protein [Sphingobacterium sp. E70]|uniref:hypothetical protein n=1 Tax=Sphingobacterium sp. E70 TaxID=2853439 RepID=UPI0027953B12|nr:hypothetical protein [Sphingobacterium sp. E70]
MLSSYTFTDEETKAGMDRLVQDANYIACPHTAIAWLGAQAYANDHPGTYASVFLSTAHPCKFPDAIDADVFAKIVLPAGAEALQEKKN